MSCQYREPPEDAPCFSTATHRASLKGNGWTRVLQVCQDHALTLRAEGWDVVERAADE